MRFNVEAGTLRPREENGRVILPVYPMHGEPVELALSPLAAHDLGMVLPGLVEQAAGRPIVEVVAGMPPIGDVVDEMQADGLERTAVRGQAEDGPGAWITYAVTGRAGAVSLMLPDPIPDDYTAGALDVHSRAPRGLDLAPCPVLPEGQCWPDGAYRGGATAFQVYQEFGEDALYDELAAWYAAQLADTDG